MKKPPDRPERTNRHSADRRSRAHASSAVGTHAHTARTRAAQQQEADGPNDQQHSLLRGWKAIAEFLALPVATAQRWGRSGMPVHREGRFTVADPDELRAWLGRESAMPAPAHIATNTADLAAGLRQSISAVRRHKRAS